MGLFDGILSAIGNAEQLGSSDQLGSILDVVGQLSNTAQTDPAALQSAMSIVGNFTRTALQEQRNNGGEEQVNQIVNQFGGTNSSSEVVNMLFSNPQIQQIANEVESRTGINAQTVEQMLPTLVPLVLNFLKSGAASGSSITSNPLVQQFLDADNDGDVDLSDAMNMAQKYLGR
jgi:hypothetical protein